jgi:hypothetical protein
MNRMVALDVFLIIDARAPIGSFHALRFTGV